MSTWIHGINLYDMHAKNQLHLSFPFLDIAKVLQTCYFGYFGPAWLWLVKAMLPACRKCWCLSSCKKPYLPLISFLKYYKNIVNLLFWVLWTNLLKTLMFICKQKLNLNPHFFYRYYYTYYKFCNQERFGQKLQSKSFARLGFEIERQESKELSFAIVLEKQMTKSLKNTKTFIFRNIVPNEFTTKIGISPFLTSIVP